MGKGGKNVKENMKGGSREARGESFPGFRLWIEFLCCMYGRPIDLIPVFLLYAVFTTTYQSVVIMVYLYAFYRASSYASTALTVIILSVRRTPSVRHTRTLWQTKQCTADILILHERAITHSFLTSRVVGGRCSFRLKFALKVTSPFEKHRLRQISAYNVSTARDSKKVQLWPTIP